MKNDDPDICVYALRIHERVFPYPSDWMMYSYHNGRLGLMWADNKGWDKQPKDGDICPRCGREILIFKETY